MEGAQEEMRIAKPVDEETRGPVDEAILEPVDEETRGPVDEAIREPVDEETREPGIRLDSAWMHRFLMGFLIAAAVFFVEAGVAEIALARNTQCVRSLSGLRLAPNPDQACMSELGRYVAQSVSRAAFGSDTPQALVWLLLAGGYGLLGGAFSQLKLQLAVAGYLIAHVLLLAGFTSIAFLSQFIA